MKDERVRLAIQALVDLETYRYDAPAGVSDNKYAKDVLMDLAQILGLDVTYWPSGYSRCQCKGRS